MHDILKKLLNLVTDDGIVDPKWAYNIREDGACAGRQNSQNVTITSKEGVSGIDITVKPGTKGERVYIPACITHSNVDDLVYNDFHIGAGADVTIVAGCGVHTEGEEDSQHNGIHRFFIAEGARVVYLEKHIGIGEGTGKRIINPETYVELARDATMQMDTTQIKGVDSTVRTSRAVLEAGSRLIIREKIMTHGQQRAETVFHVDLNGEDAGCDLVSRSVARGESFQLFRSVINGNTRCTGHSECDAIIMDGARVSAVPELTAAHIDASLVHEAAIGKIAGEQIIKLETLGLSEQEAERKIIEGFLK
nr:SufD family Fe-S cluster assembly protein [Maliibacterium massiliense]